MKNKSDILLCDLDAFFASVEQLDNPALHGRPVIVGGSPDQRGVVSTCSYEARKFGVRSAMPMKKAIALCPDAIVLRGRMNRYKEVSNLVLQIFEKVTPLIEVVSIDEAYLALPPGQGTIAASNIHRLVKSELGLSISVGVSYCKLLAKIACELAKPNQVGALWPEDIEEKLWPLPVRVIPGIGPIAEKSLNRLGIKTVKDLAHYPVEGLTRIFGKNSALIHSFAHGKDDRSLELSSDTKSISEETTFAEDIYKAEEIYQILFELAAGVGYRLRKAGYTSRKISIKLRFGNFKTINRSKTLAEPTDCDSEIFKVARNLFNNNHANPPWRLIGVQASSLQEEGQLTLFTPSESLLKEKKLTQARDQLHQKYGTEVIFQGRRLKPVNKDED